MRMKSRLAQGNFPDFSDYAIEYKNINGPLSVHWHDFYEFDIVTEGSGETVCNGKKYSMKRGTVSLLSPLDFHEYSVYENVKLINIQFHERDINYELLDKLSFAKNKVICMEEEALLNVEKLCELFNSDVKGVFAEEYRKKITECLIISFLNYADNEESSDIKYSNIKKAVVYLNTHFFLSPSMSETAERFYFNPSYFSRAFKENTGLTYKEYLRRLKLEYSRKLINYTDLSLIDVAIKSGYETQSHFCREFKECYGFSPTKLRKSIFS